MSKPSKSSLKRVSPADALSVALGSPPTEEEFLIALDLSQGPEHLDEHTTQWIALYRMARDGGDLRTTFHALQSIFAGFNNANRADEALLVARWFRALARDAGDRLVEAHALHDIAGAHYQVGDHVAALACAREALRCAAALEADGVVAHMSGFSGPHAVRAMAANVVRSIEQSHGKLRRALADAEAALQLEREAGEPLRIASALQHLGLVHKELGQLDAAASRLEEGLRITETAGFSNERHGPVLRAGLLGNLGVVLTWANDPARAVRLISESLSIYDALDDDFGRTGGLGQMGRALLRGGRVDEAIVKLEEMLGLAVRSGGVGWRQAAHVNLGRAHLLRGERGQAATHIRHAITLADEKLGRVPLDLYWLRAVAFAPALAPDAAGDPARFIALADAALNTLQDEMRGSLPHIVADRWIDEFEVLIDTVLLQPAAARLTLTPSGLSPEEQALAAAAQKSRFLGRSHLEIGLHCVEALRAQGFQERLLADAADLEMAQNPDLLLELAQVENELNDLESRPPLVVTGTIALDEAGQWRETDTQSDASITAQERDYAAHYQRRAELAQRHDVLLRKTLEAPDVVMAPLPEPPDLESLRGALRDDELFLEYVLLGQGDRPRPPQGQVLDWPAEALPTDAYVIAVGRSWADVILLGPTGDVEAACGNLRDTLDRFGGALSLPVFESDAAAAFDLLLRPVWNRAGAALDGIRHLVVAPDGALHLLPLDLLIKEARGAACWSEVDFLARRFSMEITASARLFIDSRQGRYRRGEPGHRFVGLGAPDYSAATLTDPLDPLPASRRELKDISTLVGDTGESASKPALLMDDDASKARLMDAGLLAEARYLHLACHATAMTAPYVEGALFLSQTPGAAPDQSILTYREIMDCRTNARVVVMSACESGLGALERGEGVQGLARAWLFAGAQAVVATLWRVDDEATAELLPTFYRALLAPSGEAVEALAQAKRMAIASDALACPAFWGAFTVTGGRIAPPAAGAVLREPDLDAIDAVEAPRAVDWPAAERAELQLCASAWAAIWTGRQRKDARAFCLAAEHLATATQGDANTAVLLKLLRRNCAIALDHFARQGRPELAICAYRASVAWSPDRRDARWEAVVAAYAPQNLQDVRRLQRSGRLTKSFELRLDLNGPADLRTTLRWTPDPAAADPSALDIAVPVAPNGRSDHEGFTLCSDLGWAVVRLSPGDQAQIAETPPNSIAALDENTYVVADVWGSSLVSHELLLRLPPDCVPLRLQRRALGRSASRTLLRFEGEHAIVTLVPSDGPWLEEVAVLFRHAPGAGRAFSAPASPFREDLDFDHYERLLAEVRAQDHPP